MKSNHAQDLQKKIDGIDKHQFKDHGTRHGKTSRVQLVGATVVDVSPANPSDGQMVADPHPLFSNISIEDVNQGIYADCFFLTVLQALANCDKGRSWIQQNIYLDPQNSQRVIVQFTRNGTITKVHMDLLISLNGNRLNAQDGDLWVEIGEKGYAYFRSTQNSYASISYGFASAAASDLGLTSTSIVQTATANLFTTIRNNLSNQLMCTFATPAVPGLGLIGSHEYTITGIDANNNVTARNPWGAYLPNPYVTISSVDFLKTSNVSYIEVGTIPTVTVPVKGPVITNTTLTNVPVESYSAISGCKIETGFGFPDLGYVDAILGASVEYDLNVQAAGKFGLTLGLATNGTTAALDVFANNVLVGHLEFLSANWGAFINKSMNVDLPVGAVKLKIASQKPTQYNVKSIAIGPVSTVNEADQLRSTLAQVKIDLLSALAKIG